jgi:drug/metabolite transporter (DMT)-like permease
VVLWSFGIAAVAMNATAPLWDFPVAVLHEHTSMLGRFAGWTVPLALLLLWVVVMGTLMPFGVELLALSHLSAATVTMVAMLEPVGVSALGWFWFGESLGPVPFVGCALVLVGIVAAQSGRAPHPLPEPPHLAGP